MTLDELITEVTIAEISQRDGRVIALREEARALHRGRTRRALASFFVRVGVSLDRDVIGPPAPLGTTSHESADDKLAWSFR